MRPSFIGDFYLTPKVGSATVLSMLSMKLFRKKTLTGLSRTCG